MSALRFLCLILLAASAGCLDPAEIIQSDRQPPGDDPKHAANSQLPSPNSAPGDTSDVSGELAEQPNSAESLMTAITESHEKMSDTLAKMLDVESAQAQMDGYKRLLKEQMRYMEQVKERPELSDKYGGHQFVLDPGRRNAAVTRHSAEKNRIRRSPELKPILEQAFKDLNYNEWYRKLEGIPDFGPRPKTN